MKLLEGFFQGIGCYSSCITLRFRYFTIFLYCLCHLLRCFMSFYVACLTLHTISRYLISSCVRPPRPPCEHAYVAFSYLNIQGDGIGGPSGRKLPMRGCDMYAKVSRSMLGGWRRELRFKGPPKVTRVWGCGGQSCSPLLSLSVSSCFSVYISPSLPLSLSLSCLSLSCLGTMVETFQLPKFQLLLVLRRLVRGIRWQAG